jgi:hypothetical protein
MSTQQYASDGRSGANKFRPKMALTAKEFLDQNGHEKMSVTAPVPFAQGGGFMCNVIYDNDFRLQIQSEIGTRLVAAPGNKESAIWEFQNSQPGSDVKQPGKKSILLDLDGQDTFCAALKQIDQKCIDTVRKLGGTLYPKKNSNQLEAHISANQKTLLVDDQYGLSMRIRISYSKKTDSDLISVFKSPKDTPSSMSEMMGNDLATLTFDIFQFYFSANMFGTTVFVDQCKIYPEKRVSNQRGFAIRDGSDKEVVVQEEEKDDEPSPKRAKIAVVCVGEENEDAEALNESDLA